MCWLGLGMAEITADKGPDLLIFVHKGEICVGCKSLARAFLLGAYRDFFFRTANEAVYFVCLLW